VRTSGATTCDPTPPRAQQWPRPIAETEMTTSKVGQRPVGIVGNPASRQAASLVRARRLDLLLPIFARWILRGIPRNMIARMPVKDPPILDGRRPPTPAVAASDGNARAHATACAPRSVVVLEGFVARTSEHPAHRPPMMRFRSTPCSMALRELVDSHGVHWTVFAVRPTYQRRGAGTTRPELAQGWLCFQCDTDRRRLPGIPAGWDSLTDGELLLLLASAPADPRVGRVRGQP